MLFMDWRGLKTLLEAAELAGFSLLNIVVWAKTNADMGSLYRSQLLMNYDLVYRRAKYWHDQLYPTPMLPHERRRSMYYQSYTVTCDRI